MRLLYISIQGKVAILALVLTSALLGLCALAGAIMAGAIDGQTKAVLLAVVALVAASVAASSLTALRLLGQLTELRDDALEVARRLPSVMDHLSANGHLDVKAEALALALRADETRPVREAFRMMQRAAADATVGQAGLRSGTSALLRNVAQRSQELLHQQLNLLDALERRRPEAAEPEALARLGRLTMRMQRHAQSLVVLAGDRSAQTWTEPVPLADVLGGAVAGVVDYPRIRVICISRAALREQAVADSMHLIAELAENAAVLSPAHSPVRIVARTVARGLAVEIEDCGPGLSREKMAEINASFLDPPLPDPPVPVSPQLGLYVAARLARRHGIRVTFRSSPLGGTTVILLIPAGLIVTDAAGATWDQAPAAEDESGEGSSLLTGRPATSTPGAVEPEELPDWLRELPDWIYGDGAVPPAPPEPSGAPADGRERPAGPEVPAAGADGSKTAFDLPWRVRQANLAPQLREPRSAQDAEGNGEDEAKRSPEQVRDRLSALQRGWERGRRAARSLAAELGEIAADDTDQPLAHPPAVDGPHKADW